MYENANFLRVSCVWINDCLFFLILCLNATQIRIWDSMNPFAVSSHYNSKTTFTFTLIFLLIQTIINPDDDFYYSFKVYIVYAKVWMQKKWSVCRDNNQWKKEKNSLRLNCKLITIYVVSSLIYFLPGIFP